MVHQYHNVWINHRNFYASLILFPSLLQCYSIDNNIWAVSLQMFIQITLVTFHIYEYMALPDVDVLCHRYNVYWLHVIFLSKYTLYLCLDSILKVHLSFYQLVDVECLKIFHFYTWERHVLMFFKLIVSNMVLTKQFFTVNT